MLLSSPPSPGDPYAGRPLFIGFDIFFEAYENVFVHEAIHTFDMKRHKGGLEKKKGSSPDLENQKNMKIDFTKYVTDPLEFSAFYQERVHMLDKFFADNKEARGKYLKNFNDFYTFISSSKNDIFITHMDEKYRRKLIKRLLDFFHSMQDKYPPKVIAL